MEFLELLAEHQSPRGVVVLRRRAGDGDPVDELIVNGAFAMDSSQTTTEQRLGVWALAGGGPRILVGGLGLGYTAGEILDRADTAGQPVEIEVAELEDCLIDWARRGLTPTLARVAADPRVRLRAGDVAEVLRSSTEPWNAILLDVDNGPDFLVHEANAWLYAADGLDTAYAKLAPGGVLAIWCQGRSAELAAELRRLTSEVTEELLPVSRGNRQFSYALYVAKRT